MIQAVRMMDWGDSHSEYARQLLTREWLVTNGRGGYASGTLSGVVTRRYHGLLVAAMPPPLGRVAMLNHLIERAHLPDGGHVDLGGEEQTVHRVQPSEARCLSEFRLEMGIPIWRYAIGEIVLEKRVIMPHRQNTVHITWQVISAPHDVRLELRPAVHFRPQGADVDESFVDAYALKIEADRYTLTGGENFPPLGMILYGKRPSFTIDSRKMENIYFQGEADLGYPSIGAHWSPGAFTTEIEPGERATLVASTETWEVIRSLSPDAALLAERERRVHLLRSADLVAQDGYGAELVMAADQFVMTPAGRAGDTARAQAAGDEVPLRDRGLPLVHGLGARHDDQSGGADLDHGTPTGSGLHPAHVRPLYPRWPHTEHVPGAGEVGALPYGRCHPLVFPRPPPLSGIHARPDHIARDPSRARRYHRASLERHALRHPRRPQGWPAHTRGEGVPADVDGRKGRFMGGHTAPRQGGRDQRPMVQRAAPSRGVGARGERERGGQRIRPACRTCLPIFNERFWYQEGGYLYDVVDGETGGNDSACRPNQILAVSLDWPVLETAKWAPVVQVVEDRLLTPVGLRSLAPGHPDYKPQYFGDLRTRDAAYHQGTVWAWLIGPFIDAWLKVHPGQERDARAFLSGFESHRGEGCIGSLSEIFDATAPYAPRGCVAQAWSVAEVLRCWVKTGR